jgi:pentatricopeptide repeat protein
MIKAYADARHLADAEALFRRMQERRVEPDVVTYSTMINMYTKADKIAEAQELVYRQIPRRGLPRTEYALDPLQRAYKLKYRGKELREKLGRLETVRREQERKRGGGRKSA